MFSIGLRIPAGEIEEIVTGQLRRMVASPEVIVATCKQLRGTPSQLTENEVRAALVGFDEVWTELFPTEQQRITSLLVDRVVVFPTRIEVHLLVRGFTSLVAELKDLASDVENAAMNKTAKPNGKTLQDALIVISIPVSFQQRGGRKQIVVPAGAADWQPRASRCENSLINALAKAHRWRRLIETGKHSSAADLSRAERINESYLCRVLRLTLLAPEIVEAILDGRQPRTLELRSLLKPLPIEWAAQRKHLGFA